MTTSYSDIDNLLILIHADDPVIYDPDFLSRLHYGGFTKLVPEFTEANREEIKSMKIGAPFEGMFVVELYTNKFEDFVYHALPSNTHFRALIFRATDISIDESDLDDDGEPLAVYSLVYELRTVGKMDPTKLIGPDDFEIVEDDDEPETYSAHHRLH